jgi:hypothetical protein
VSRLPELAGRRDAQAQELVAEALDERLRRVGEINLNAAGNAAIGLKQALDQRPRVPMLQVGKTARDALPPLLS